MSNWFDKIKSSNSLEKYEEYDRLKVVLSDKQINLLNSNTSWIKLASGTSIISGSVSEKVNSINLPIGTTTAVIKNILQDQFTAYQTQVTNDNTWQYYGTFYDGTTWTTGGL